MLHGEKYVDKAIYSSAWICSHSGTTALVRLVGDIECMCVQKMFEGVEVTVMLKKRKGAITSSFTVV